MFCAAVLLAGFVTFLARPVRSASAVGRDKLHVAIVPKELVSSLSAAVTTSWRFLSLEDAAEDDVKAAVAFSPDYVQIVNHSAISDALSRLTSGRLLQILMTGYDTLDIDSVPPRFAICNVHNAGTAIPEFVLAAVLSWNVRLPQLDSDFRSCTWRDGPSRCSRPPMHREAKGQTVGLVGFGAIGRGVAVRAAALGMRTVAVVGRPPASPPPPLAWIGDDTALPRLAAEADFVVVCLPLSPATRGLLGADFVARMRPTSVLINVGRGPVVDERALYEALASGRIGGAVLDVWWQRFEVDPKIWPSSFNFSALPNVWMTPHTSYNTQEAHEEGMRQAASNFDALARGEPLQNIVRPPQRREVVI